MSNITLTQETLAAAIATGVAQALAADREARTTEVYVDADYGHLIGKTVFIRTVTMTNVGVLAALTPTTFVLDKGAVWIANTGHWSEFCNKGTADDVEPFGPYPVSVSKEGVIDVSLMPKIPSKK